MYTLHVQVYTMYTVNPVSALSQVGALAVAVPGEVAGYWEAKKRYSNF